MGKECVACGKKPLEKDTIGINKKMLGKDITNFYCMDCLADYLGCTVYLKLLFPNVQSEIDVDKTEFRDYCLIPAMKMRRIIKLQQGFIDTEYKGKDVPFFTVDD